MKQKFKTNINCDSCIKSVTPYLNQELDIERWEVDTENPEKILTIEGDIEPKAVLGILKEAGYLAEPIT